ncbi:myopalladin isoform X1 [Hippocampus zosterae]|uniref:myopalladin isoform X1 n=1 Tax=Hippocampus zosterae TaxID=109293 RepID=UPI00223CF410|nr:myopalladin isoform X1 [Hippocampus zosterae]
MQENAAEQPPSLSQLLRESYLAEARAQQRHSEMSRSDASSSRLQIFGLLKGKAEDSAGLHESQLPDLSAFLSQEELDKSVNLARQAIGHEPREERPQVKAAITPSASASISSPTTSSVPLTKPPPDPYMPSSTMPSTQPVESPTTQPKLAMDKKPHTASTPQDNTMRNNSEGLNHFNKSVRNSPFGAETQSKKEFLNKAADFIEELSSLFKANASKRIRPRACKGHRSRNQNKSQNDGKIYSDGSDSRERLAISADLAQDGPDAIVSHQSEMQPDSGIGQVEIQNIRITEEQQFESKEAEAPENYTLTQAPSDADEQTCEPPHFIQKLKSREVPEGSKVQLDCIVRGHPTPEVRWFCEGKELENSPDIQIITNGELHSLIITEAFEEDTGRYSCFASNFYGTDSTSAEVYIEGASSSDSEGEPHFEHVAHLQGKQSESTPISSHIAAEVKESSVNQTTREPPEELGPLVTPKVPVPVQTITNSPPSPELSQASAALTAYPAEAVQVFPTSPPAHLAEGQLLPAAALLTPAPQPLNSVLPLPNAAPTSRLESQTSGLNPQQDFNQQAVMAGPVFTKSLQDLVASEGQLIVLECRVKGVPSPRVDWYKEAKIIEDSPDFRILQKKPRSPAESEEICTLVIAEVFTEDSGMFTCTASNNYGKTSSTATLKVKANDVSNHAIRPFCTLTVEPSRVQEPSASDLCIPPVKPQTEIALTNNIKPHASTIRLDPLANSTLRLDPLNTSTLRLHPNKSSMLRPDTIRTSIHGLDPNGFSGGPTLNPRSVSTPTLDPHTLRQEPPASTGQQAPHPKPYTAPPAVEQEASRAMLTSPDASSNYKAASNHQNGASVPLALPNPPPNSCLKSGVLTNHKDSRSSSRVGLRVHFKLPEDEEGEQSEISAPPAEDASDAQVNKGPPPVLAKPRLDPAQLQLLHSQVLMEQQQESEPPGHNLPSIQFKPEATSSREGSLFSLRENWDSHSTFLHNTSQMTPKSGPPHTTTSPAPSRSSAPAINTPPPPLRSFPSTSQVKTTSLVTMPPPKPQLNHTPPFSVAPSSQMTTVHASHVNPSTTVLTRTAATAQFSSQPVSNFSSTSTDVTSPAAFLRSTHASLMNLTATSQAFNYTRPKEFITGQTFSPVRSPSPTESPVPLLQELAAALHSSATISPALPPFSPPTRTFPTRVLQSPSSPPSLISSPTPGSAPTLNNAFTIRAQSPPQASSPTSSTSTPSPIQNPVAFLSAILPSLTLPQPTNSMGLPKGAPSGFTKKAPKTRLPSTEITRESKDAVLYDIEKKLQFQDDLPIFAYQQKRSIEGKTASRPLVGPNIPATVISYDEEYKVSNFEQRLMSEIEFRLERTPVEESDDDVQHDDVPSGKCIAPIFDKKLKNYKAMEGVPVTFTCKVVGIPVPKVYWFKDGKQILRKNIHYKKIREGDGTCALHIESTTADDDGNYTIMAANPQGRISCSGHLIIHTGPPRNRLTPINSQRVRTRIQEVEGEQSHERFFQPHFVQAPGDTLAHEGRVCRLDCKVSGLPNPELMWLVNGRPIYPDLYHKMLVRENGVHSLVIDPLTQKDAGTYTCIASNKAGQGSFSLELKVVEKEMKHPPQFVEKLQNVGIPEGNPVRMECRVVGMPHPVIFWKKDNDTIPRTQSRMSMHQDATGYVCLLIQPTTKEDAGWYTVSAKNEAGIAACTCRLDIYAQWHQSVPAPMKKTAGTGSRYAALTGQGLDIKSAFPTSETHPFLFSSSPPEATLESEEL